MRPGRHPRTHCPDTHGSSTAQDISVLGRFDAIVDAQMDAGFERADQQYRNAAKVLAAGFAIVLALLGIWVIEGDSVSFADFMFALFIGAISTPLAPIANPENAPLGANIVQGVDILWD
jgi:hypothetical protein